MHSETSRPVGLQSLDWALQTAEGKNPFRNTVTDDQIGEMHAIAYLLYNRKRYLESSHYFRLLTAAQPSEPKYWKGLGACLQMLKQYEEAINCYASAQILNGKKTDPYLYMHTADCLIALKEIDQAFHALQAARKRALKTKDRRVLEHVKLMREIWVK